MVYITNRNGYDYKYNLFTLEAIPELGLKQKPQKNHKLSLLKKRIAILFNEFNHSDCNVCDIAVDFSVLKQPPRST